MIRNQLCAIALIAAAAIVSPAGPASAGSRDGNWGIFAQTTQGHCENVQFGLTIDGHRIYSTGGSYGGYAARVTGHVSHSGRVRVTAVAGPRVANGRGYLGHREGGGTWSGRGPSGTCSGVWNAWRSWF
jgi:dipeptidyl aminopeptidase/acylaminoacyl peptidase